MSVPDRSLYLLTSNGISYTKNEMLAIKLHDGMYDESNKVYLTSFTPEAKPRTSMVYILHQADILASRIEFEQYWLPKFGQPKSNILKKSNIKQKVMASQSNPELLEAVNSFFNK